MKFLHKILLTCILCAVIPIGLTVVVMWVVNPAALDEVLAFTGLAVGLVLIGAVLAAFLLNREFQQAIQGLQAALDQFSLGLTHSRASLQTLPATRDELGRLLSELSERLRVLAVLQETTRDLTAELEMPRLLQTIAERASALMGVTGGVIYEADLARRKLRLVAAVGLTHSRASLQTGLMHARASLGTEVDFGEDVAGRVAESGQSLVAQDWPADTHKFPESSQFPVLSVPILWRGQLLGVLDVKDEVGGRVFTERDVALAEEFAGQAAAAIHSAGLRARAEQQAHELDTLLKAQAAASASLDLDKVLTAIVEQVGRALNVTSAYVVEVGDTHATVVAEYYSAEASERERQLSSFSSLSSFPLESLRKTMQVVYTGRPAHVAADDPEATDFEREHFRHYDGRATMVVPLVRQGRPLGYVHLWESRRDRVFTEAEIQLAQALGGHVATALENARLYQTAQRQAEQMRLVNEVGRDLAGILDVDSLLTQVSQRLEKTFGYYHAKVGLLAPQPPQAGAGGGDQIVFPAWFDARRNRLMPEMRLAVDGPGLIAWVARNAQPRLTLDVQADADYLPNINFPETRSEVVAPLIAHNQLIGVLDVQSDRPDGLGPEDLAVLEAISGQLAVAVENARLYQAARRRAEQMQLINEVGRDIAGLLDVEALMDKVGQRLEAAFGYYHANAGLIEGKEIIFRARYSARRQMTIPEIRLLLDGPGLIAWVARNARTRLAADAQADALFMPYPFFPETRSEMALPLIAQDRIIGVLDVQSDRPGGLGPDDLTTLEVIGGQLAVAVENARLYAEARQRADEVSALLSTTLALSSSMRLERRLDSIAQFARRLVNADSCTIYKLDAEAQVLRPLVIHDKYAAQISAVTIALGEGITGLVALTGKGELVNRVELDPRGKPVPDTPQTPENLIAVPLKVSQRTTGVMTVHREGMRGFKPHDLNLIASFATQAAVAIESAELYQELETRANSLQAAYDELAQGDQLKDEMVQNISHELRTPITFLKSYVDLLLDGQFGPLLPEQEKGLRVVADKTNTLVRLVNDILTLQVVGPDTLKRQPLDLATIARAAADGVAAAAQEAGLHLTAKLPETPVIISGDSLRLSQVFDNLFSNAMKFTDPGGDIHLAVLPGSDSVRVEVRDTGIGIATDKLGHVFDRFYQVDGPSATRRRSGIGLGLSICKQIVESHGGRMAVESRVGHGSCFYFILPLAASMPTSASEGTSE